MSTLQPMRDHWWWRPGWSVGRSFLTWHITFDGDVEVARLARAYAPALSQLPIFDPIPLQWLHLTMQGLGFTDEIERADVDRVVDRARSRCGALEPFTITVGPAIVDPEALALPVHPIEALAEVRDAIRAAIADAWGGDNVPEAADIYRPHISLGHSNSAGPAEPAIEVLAVRAEHTADVTVRTVSLIALNRDHKQYRWSDIAAGALGRP